MIEKSKEMGIVNRFFSYFTWAELMGGVPFKVKSSGCTWHPSGNF